MALAKGATTASTWADVPSTGLLPGEYLTVLVATPSGLAARALALDRFTVVDTMPPVTTDDFAADGVWIKTAPSITLTATDACSGVKQTSYTVGGTTTVGTQFTVSSEGETVVSYRSEDQAGNIEGDQQVTVRLDQTAPAVTVADVTVEQATAAGTAVTLTATVSDNLDPAPVVGWSHGPTAVFPLGTTAVTVTATDQAGNQTVRALTVRVVDTTAPTVTAGPDVAATVGETIALTAVVNDACDAAPVMVWSRGPTGEAGVEFPVGTTLVTVTATDASANVGTDTVTVTVREGGGSALGDYGVYGAKRVKFGEDVAVGGVVGGDHGIHFGHRNEAGGIGSGGVLLSGHGNVVRGPVVSTGGVTIGEDSTVQGAIDSQAAVTLQRHVQVQAGGITASGRVEVFDAGTVAGTVASGAGGTAVKVYSDGVLGADVRSAGDVALGKRARVVGTVYHAPGTALNLAAGASVGGEVIVPVTVTPAAFVPVRWPAATVIQPGANDVQRGNGAVVDLAPGAYGKVKLGKNGVLRLRSGRYDLADLELGANNRLEFALSGGLVEVLIAGDVHVGDGLVSVLNGGGAELVYWECQGGEFHLGKDATWAGTVYAVGGHIHCVGGNGQTVVTGALYAGGRRPGEQGTGEDGEAGMIDLGNHVEVRAAPTVRPWPAAPPAGQGEGR